MAQKDDLTITVKDGKNLIKDLIEAINANTEALLKDEKAPDEPKQTEETTTEKPEAEIPQTPTPAPTVPTQPVQPTQTPPTAQTATPVATVPGQVNFSQPPMNIPAGQNYTQSVQNSMPATPYSPASAAGPAQVTESGIAATPTATYQTVSVAPTSGAEKTVTRDALATAIGDFVNTGTPEHPANPNAMPQFIALLTKYGVPSFNLLPDSALSSFANDLRTLGVNI